MQSLCFPYVHCLRNHEIILSHSHSSSTEQLHFTRTSASGAIHYLLVDNRSILIRPILDPGKRSFVRRYQFNWPILHTILMTKNVITFNGARWLRFMLEYCGVTSESRNRKARRPLISSDWVNAKFPVITASWNTFLRQQMRWDKSMRCPESWRFHGNGE
jgi:hypothetical protein